MIKLAMAPGAAGFVATMLVATMALAAAQAPATTQAADPAAVKRGDYLVNTIMTCGNCHTPKGPQGDIVDRAFSGGLTFDEKPFRVTASNITPDVSTGIGSWTVADIARTLTTGVRPNGIALAPIMPTGFYGVLTPSDLAAVAAYLKSVKPLNNAVPSPVYHIAVARQVFPGAEKPFSAADLADKTKRGFYLATIGHCMECHTPRVEGQLDFAAIGRGGQDFPGPWGTSRARNITSHADAGLGKWTNDEIKRAITQGVSRDGTRLKPPMGYGYYARMTADDLDALVAYLRTVPPQP